MATAKRAFYLNGDKSKVVEEGDDAAFLLVGVGADFDEQIGVEFGDDIYKQLKTMNAAGFEVVEAKDVPEPPEDKAVKSATTKGKN